MTPVSDPSLNVQVHRLSTPMAAATAVDLATRRAFMIMPIRESPSFPSFARAFRTWVRSSSWPLWASRRVRTYL